MKKYLLSLIICMFSSAAMFSQDIIVEENFNATFPADWMSIGNSTDGGWAVHSPASLSSQYWTVADAPDGSTFVGTNDDACNCDKSADRLVLPALDLSAAPDFIFLSYDKQYFARGFQGAVEVMTVEVSYDDGATWESIHEIPANTVANWENEVINLSGLNRVAGVLVAFRYNDNGGWLFGAALDNISVYAPRANDARLSVDDDYQFVDIDNFNVTGSIINVGGENITTVDIVVDAGSGPMTETISGLNIAPLESASFEVPLPLANPQPYTVTVSAINPNGVDDEDMSNNDGTRDVIGVANPPSKMVFVEESTGTWCPWCPRGAVFMDMMEENYPESIAGVAVHVGIPNWPDPMEVPVYGQTYAQTVGGFPTLVIDRDANPGIPGINDMLAFGASLRDFARNRPSPVGIETSASIDEATNQMMIDIDISLHSNLDNQIYSIVTLVTEDHVTGDAFDYRQANNYAPGTNNGPMGGWESLPNPASGADIEFNHTLRAALDGYSGTATIIPQSFTSGETASYSLTYDIPAEYDNTEMNVAVVVIDLNNDGAALNTDMVRNVGFSVGVEDIEELSAFNAFPNPAQDFINVELNFTENLNYNIVVNDIQGNKVMDLGKYNDSSMIKTVDVSDLASGVYFIAVHSAKGQNVMKFTKL